MMKVVVFKGGLGNTLFEYAHYLYLKEKFPKGKIYAYYPPRALRAHNGFELAKRFEVSLPSESILSTIIGAFFHNVAKIGRRLNFSLPFMADEKHPDLSNAIVYEDYFQNAKYIPQSFALEFILPHKLSKENITTLKSIHEFNSVAIHVRRGDYLKYPNLYKILEYADYYKPAIDIMKSKFKDVHFFIFSDDISWCKETFTNYECTFVDWNKGEDSYLDMYLMSLCKGVIMANSTFSFWGASLNKNKPVVVMPKYWGNTNVSPEQLYRKGWIMI